jgi:hypothetical protein
MSPLKNILCVLTAIFVGFGLPTFFNSFKGVTEQKATGLGAVGAGLAEPFLSPFWWLLALGTFVVFFAASRLRNKTLRTMLFWAPAVTASGLLLILVGLFTYVFTQARHG